MQLVVFSGTQAIWSEAVITSSKVSGDDYGSDSDLPDSVYSSADTGGSRWEADFANNVKVEQDSKVKQNAREMQKKAVEYSRLGVDAHAKPRHGVRSGVMRREDGSALSEQHDDLERTQWWGNFGMNEDDEQQVGIDDNPSTRGDIEEFTGKYESEPLRQNRIETDVSQDTPTAQNSDDAGVADRTEQSSQGNGDSDENSASLGNGDNVDAAETKDADDRSLEDGHQFAEGAEMSQHTDNEQSEQSPDGGANSLADNADTGMDEADDGRNMMQGGGGSLLENPTHSGTHPATSAKQASP